MPLVEVRLISTEMVNTPGILAWAINGYAFKKDRPALLKVLMDGYRLTKKCATDLLSKTISYTIGEDNSVIFQYEEGQYLRN
jgi:hypothetical protein